MQRWPSAELFYVRSILLAGVAVYVLLVAGLRIYVETYKQVPIERPVAALVVLSAGPMDEERIYRTAARTQFAAQLYQDLVASGERPILVTTGCCDSRGPAMADLAHEMGVPLEAIRIEDRSRSTLQNALFSREFLNPGSGHILVITDKFHLPRSWASFRWAGVSNLVMVAADGEDEPVDWDNLLFEAPKWPINLVRATAYTVLSAFGWPEHELYRMLD